MKLLLPNLFRFVTFNLTIILFYESKILFLSAQVGNTSPRSGGRSVGIVRSRTQTMELKKKKILFLLKGRHKFSYMLFF
jgi:hypothetical protein